MKKINKNFYLLLLIAVVGCVPLQERFRRFAGTSVDHFEKYRSQAIVQTASCEISDCYETILAIGKNAKGQPRLEKHFEVFQANTKESFIVFYNIPGQIDTTEVVVFLTPEDGRTKIEVVSLSTPAKEKVAKVVFSEINANF